MIEEIGEYVKHFSDQERFYSQFNMFMKRGIPFEKVLDDYEQSINEMRESLLKEYFDYKGIDYKKIELQCKNMNNFKLKDGLFHKISYSDGKGAHYYFKEEFIMSEECGVFYLGEWKQ